MTLEQKREVIRRVCIAANPEIVGLEFGCAISTTRKGYEVTGLTNGYIVGKDFAVMNDPKNIGHLDVQLELLKGKPDLFNIIGRPIRLADVVLAAKEKRKQSLKAKVVDIFEEIEDWTDILDFAGVENELEYLWYHWKLTQDDLSLQGERTINFLYEILK